MRPPKFWFRPPGLRAAVLAPLGAIYSAQLQRRLARPGVQLGIPVICVGNVNLGGTGKTPTVIDVVTRLQAMGHSPHVVTRGYKGRLKGPLLVDSTMHNAGEVGDEALLLSAFAPVWVSKDRAAGGQKAEQAGADVVVLDDGMQNPCLVKDLTLMVVDAGIGFGNGHVFPAGPLREPAETGAARADLLVSIGGSVNLNRPKVIAWLEPIAMGMDWSLQPLLAFAGIGRPEKFFKTLRGLGATLVATHALGDHQALPDALMQRLSQEAAAKGAQLVTTEKDAIRLSPKWRGQVLTLPVRLRFEDAEPLDDALEQVMRG